MCQPVTRAPLALVVAEATTLTVLGTVAPLAGELTVTVTVASAAAGASRQRARMRIGRIDKMFFLMEDLLLWGGEPQRTGRQRWAPTRIKVAPAAILNSLHE